MRKRSRKLGPSLRSKISEEAGQGTVEYLLIVVIVVIIILSLLYRFSDSFRQYTEAFFDGYISCLLETGELPGTGSTCAGEFAAYDASKGKGLLKDNLPEGKGGKGSTGGNSNQSGTKATSGDSGGSRSTGETVGGRSGGSGGGGAGGGGSSASTREKFSGSKSESMYGGGSNGPSSTAVGRYKDGLRPDGGGTRIVYYDEAEAPNATQKAKPPTSKVGEVDKFNPSKVAEAAYRAPAAKTAEEGGDLSVSGLIRLFIILILLVAIAIFFGGQLLQIMKSREKGGD